jgi:hypothetical protein
MSLLGRLEFARCSRCGHDIALARPATVHGWAHHIRRARRRVAPHWPGGHVLTVRCLREPCVCTTPSPNLDYPVKSRLVYLGRASDPFRE